MIGCLTWSAIMLPLITYANSAREKSKNTFTYKYISIEHIVWIWKDNIDYHDVLYWNIYTFALLKMSAYKRSLMTDADLAVYAVYGDWCHGSTKSGTWEPEILFYINCQRHFSYTPFLIRKIRRNIIIKCLFLNVLFL